MKKRFFAALLCLCLLVGLVPGMGTTAFAADSFSIGDTVEFAGHDWYIIGTETEGVTAPSGCYTLFAKNNDFGSTAFRAGANDTDSTANHYKDSDLHKKMEEIASEFSDDDKNNIVARDTLDDIAGEAVSNQLLWPISKAEWKSIAQSLRAFSTDYWTRASWEDNANFEYVYRVHKALATGDSLDGYEGVLSYPPPVTFSNAVRPALYVEADGLSSGPPIIIVEMKFTLQPQTQYAVEGGSITFTAKAEIFSQEITGDSQYTWQVQAKDGSDDTWYEVKRLVSIPPISYGSTYYGQALTISNVSGTWEDNGYYMKVDFQPKDALFRCVAKDNYSDLRGYSDTAEIVVVAAGGSQDGEDGREVELRTNEETRQIQWRYAGEADTAWRDLVALDAITGGSGADGADGREVQLQVDSGYIQWKYDTDADWQNLIALSDLKGADGEDGEEGREVELQNDGTSIQWRYEGETEWKDLVDLSDLTGADGSDGANGKQVELRVEGGYIQWKYDADSDWQNLIALSALQGIKGDKGDKGDPGEDGDTPYIGSNGNWWIDGVDTGIPATGSSGSDGSDGSDGKDGQDGKDGKDGEDGLTPYIGSNGNWWIGTTDTGIKAAGTDGADGVDGKDGLTPYIGSNGNWWIGTTDTGIKAAGTDGVDGANGKNGADGQDGSDGVGIADIQLNENGELIITLTDGTEKNLGKVTGEDGVGISGVSINENGELIVTLTDGTELNAGAVPTAAAETSELKTIVYVSMGTAGASLAGMLGLLAFLLTKRKMLIGK